MESKPMKPIQQMPIYSSNPDDLQFPGVILIVDPEEADDMGAFEETAMSEEDAWESNMDLGVVVE